MQDTEVEKWKYSQREQCFCFPHILRLSTLQAKCPITLLHTGENHSRYICRLAGDC